MNVKTVYRYIILLKCSLLFLFLTIQVIQAKTYCPVHHFFNFCKLQNIDEIKSFINKNEWLESGLNGNQRLQKITGGIHKIEDSFIMNGFQLDHIEFSDLNYVQCNYIMNINAHPDYNAKICTSEISTIKNYLPKSYKEVIDIKSDENAVYHWTYKQGTAKKMISIKVTKSLTIFSLVSLTLFSSN